jgi:transposase
MSFEQLSKKELIEIIEQQALLIQQLTARVEEVEKKLGKNSRNSHRPPSSDGFKKVRRTKSERSSTTKKTGGQPGHKGYHLPFSSQPDFQEVHALSDCSSCGCSLEQTPVDSYQKRQVWDLPPLSLRITEHQAEQKICPCCQQPQTASFPAHVEQRIQYGSGVQAFLVYLHQTQLIPYARTVEVMRDLFGHTISEGTLSNMIRRAAEKLDPLVEDIRKTILSSPVIHADETGMDVLPKRQWVHVYSTAEETYYAIHPKRGRAAIDDIGFLSAFTGTAVHDAWQAYFPYVNCTHALCNAHILRELTYLHEQEKQEWAGLLHQLLLEMKKQKELYQKAGLMPPPKVLAQLTARYDARVAEGCEKNPVVYSEETLKKKGSKKQSPARNMLDRLLLHREKILLFLKEPNVPFDNNQAERDLRMMRVKEKISGLFRSEAGAQAFCLTRSFISTIRKKKGNVLDSLVQAIEGRFVFP